jgi:hypothetical protein
VLHDGVRSGADRPGVAIVKSDDIGRTAVVPVYLDDLSAAIRLAHGVPVHV